MMDDDYKRALSYVSDDDRATFDEAWQRRSAVMLDSVGIPPEIIERRCPSLSGWGTLLYFLTTLTKPSQ